MERSKKLRRRVVVLICLLGAMYVAISLANLEGYAGDKATDVIKLGLIVALCTLGFVSGRDYFRFTHTTPVFLAAMILFTIGHVTELTEEFAALQSVPLFGEVTLAKKVFETVLMIGGLCLFLGGIFLSVSDINDARQQLESNVHCLAERERRYRALFEAANDAILIMRNDKFLYCNSRTLEMFGCAQDQIVGQTPYHFSPPMQPDGQDSREMALRKLADVLAGEPQSFAWRHRRYDGTPFDAEVSLNRVELSDGPCVQAIVRDFSARKRSEAKSARLTAILENTSDLVGTATPDGHVTYLNDAGRQMLDWPDEEAVSTHRIADVHPDWAFRLITQEGIPAAVDTGTWAGETAVRSRDGTEIPVSQVIMSHKSEDGSLEYLSTVIRDLRERKRAEEALQESEAKMRSVFRAAPIGIGLVSQRAIVDVNDRLCEIIGYTKEELVGKNARVLYPTDEDYEYVGTEKYRQIDERGTGTVETRFLCKDGRILDVLLSSTPLDANDLAAGVTFTALDITERKRVQEDLMAHQRRLQSLASELSLAEERERRRIAAGLHDDTCQTLVLSKMKLQELCDPRTAPDPSDIASVCQTLDRTVESVRGLVFDLSSPTLYKFGLEAALEELLEDKLTTEHGIHCTFSDDGAFKPLAEDVRILLYQSVRELLINIVKHAQAREVALDITRVEDTVRITVTDDGIGFDVKDVLSTSSRTHGFGLFNIAERLDYLGGSLDIDSQPGRGSRFTILAHLETPQTTG